MKMSSVLAVLLIFVASLVTVVGAETSDPRPHVLSTSGKTITLPETRSDQQSPVVEKSTAPEETRVVTLGDRVLPSITQNGQGLRQRPGKRDQLLVDQLCIDEGVMANAWVFTTGGNAWAVQYTAPIYPALIESVQVYVLSEGDPYWPWPDNVHQPFAICIFDEAAGQPGTEVFRDTVQADTLPPSWVTAYPNVIINSGDFWVAAEQFEDSPNCEAVGTDSSDDYGPQNWYRVGGVWTQNPGLGGDLMMCAFVSPAIDTSSVIFSGNSVVPPTIDGVIDSIEWAEATVKDVSDVLGGYDGPNPLGSAWLYVKNDEVMLYMALDAVWDTSMSDYDDFSPYIDDNNDGLWPGAPDSTEGNFWFESMASGADSVIRRFWQTGPSVGGQYHVPFPVGITMNSGHQQFEGAIPFGLRPEELQALPGDTVGFFALAYHANTAEIYCWWPYTVSSSGWNDPVNYGDLVLAPGLPPVIMLAEASDNLDSLPGIDPDDYVLLAFDEPTNKPVIDWSNIDNVFQLNNGHTWLDGFNNIGSAIWNGPGDQLMVTLSTTSGPPTIAVGDTITPDGVTVTDALGNACDSPIEITGSFGEPTGVEELKARSVSPAFFALSQNSPNPFYEETEIRYAVASRSEVSLSIYDLSGRLVRTLVGEAVERGIHAVRWDGRDETGSLVPTGIYLYRLRAGDFSSTRKLVLLR